MNEEGKSSLNYFSICLLVVLCFFEMLPAYSSNGGNFPLDPYSTAFSEQFSVFFVFCLCTLLGYNICYVLSAIFHYIIYFVQRQWCLHKFRKPVMIYKGSDN